MPTNRVLLYLWICRLVLGGLGSQRRAQSQAGPTETCLLFMTLPCRASFRIFTNSKCRMGLPLLLKVHSMQD